MMVASVGREFTSVNCSEQQQRQGGREPSKSNTANPARVAQSPIKPFEQDKEADVAQSCFSAGS